MAYAVVFADRVAAHLRWLRHTNAPPYSLRVGDLRIFYDVVDDPRATVRILAVGRKRGSALYIAGKEIVL
jgi:hypothetical protein